MNVPVILRRRRPGASPLAIYAVLGIRPELVLDFDDEKYFANSSSTTFSDAITHSATSNATTVDSDGLLKWRAHNLVRYSEQFDNVAWGYASSATTRLANQVAAPSGELTADSIEFAGSGNDYAYITVAAPAGSKFRVWLRVASGTYDLALRCWATGATQFLAVTVTDQWQLFTLDIDDAESTAVGFDNRAVFGAGAQNQIVYAWGAHLYRSDLGGMVNNPDRGDSYVPTTSSAVYLPRRGHHVYNGSAWVNEGLLHESEQRVNLLTYSEDRTAVGWNNTAVSVSDDGTTISGLSASKMTYSGSSALFSDSVGAVSGTSATLSAFVARGDIDDFGSGHRFGFYDNTAKVDIGFINFDYGTGQTSVQSGTVTDHGAVILEDGWRIWMTVPITSGNELFAYFGAVGASTNAGYAYLAGPQVEAGPTPSSYIPTSGSTVTRAAETLTVPSAQLPWPTPNVIGPELVTNGTFDSDVSGWTTTSGTFSSVSSRGELVNSGAVSAVSYTSISTTAGKVYKVSADVENITALSNCRIYIGSTSGGFDLLALNTENGDTSLQSLSGFFVAVGSTTYVSVSNRAITDATAYYDNISVREIDPLAVSIQMQGRMTIEDNGLSLPVRWYKSSDDRIQLYKESNNWFFYQRSGGTLDVVSKFDPSAGTLVPFNIASRHGSTFVNGAVDGTALTADTTPTALPDLSATDLKLGFDYMGCIKLLRIWSADLGDAGISEASTS